MKSLEDFLKTRKMTTGRWEDVTGKEDEDYREDMFSQDDSYETVNEMLKSHDYNKLINKLQQIFSKFINSYDVIDNHENDKLKSFDIICFDEESMNALLNEDNFYNILNFYNYFVTHKKDNVISIEPKFSTLDNDLIENNNWIAYHFTRRENVEKILRTGLRLREDKLKTRDYPTRIYLYVPKDNDLRKQRLTCIQIIKAIHHTDTRGEMFKLSNYAILKIDFKQHTYFDFYRDSTMKPDAVFCYNNIPAKYIEEVPIDILK